MLEQKHTLLVQFLVLKLGRWSRGVGVSSLDRTPSWRGFYLLGEDGLRAAEGSFFLFSLHFCCCSLCIQSGIVWSIAQGAE